MLRAADDIWSLYDVYERVPTTASIGCRMRVCASLHAHTRVLEALKHADHLDVRLDEECLVWLLYGLLGAPGLSSFVVDVMAESQRRGLAVTYRTLTFALMYCAHHGDGDTALLLYQQYGLALDMNLTPEIVLLLLQSFRRSAAPTADMLRAAEDALHRIDQQGTAADMRLSHLEELVDLCAALGAVATAASTLKRLAGGGDSLTLRVLHGVLGANARAAAPNGSGSLTEEVVQMIRYFGMKPTAVTLALVESCVKAHGGETSVIHRFCQDAHAALSSGGSAKQHTISKSKKRRHPALPSSPQHDQSAWAPPPFLCPPHKLRRLATVWQITPEEIMLRKFGQGIPPRPKEEGQVQLRGTTVPFGRWPGMIEP